MAEKVRTFVAIELPDEARAYLAALQADLAWAGADVRWVRPDRMHLTLVFLGNVAMERLAALEEAVGGACAGGREMTLRLSGVGRFPPRGRPRVVWAGIEEPTGALPALQERLAEATAPFAEKVENRPYRAHLTLGRVRGGSARALAEAAAARAAAAGPAFEAREVLLLKSQLSPRGPTYTPLARLPLLGQPD